MTYVWIIYLLGWAIVLTIVRDVAPTMRDVWRILIAGLWPIMVIYCLIRWRKINGKET